MRHQAPDVVTSQASPPMLWSQGQCAPVLHHTHISSILTPDTMLPMIEFEPFRTVYNNHNKKCWKKTKCKRMVRKLTRATDKQFYK